MINLASTYPRLGPQRNLDKWRVGEAVHAQAGHSQVLYALGARRARARVTPGPTSAQACKSSRGLSQSLRTAQSSSGWQTSKRNVTTTLRLLCSANTLCRCFAG